MSTSTGYGPRSTRWDALLFDGDERNYEMWEIKFLSYMNTMYFSETICVCAMYFSETMAVQCILVKQWVCNEF